MFSKCLLYSQALTQHCIDNDENTRRKHSSPRASLFQWGKQTWETPTDQSINQSIQILTDAIKKMKRLSHIPLLSHFQIHGSFLLVVVWMCVWMCICIYTYIPKNIDAACLVFAMLLVWGGGRLFIIIWKLLWEALHLIDRETFMWCKYFSLALEEGTKDYWSRKKGIYQSVELELAPDRQRTSCEPCEL